MILLSLLLYGCGGGEPMEYDEEIVKKEALEYLEEKYNGSYLFADSRALGGRPAVQVKFVDLNRSDNNETTLVYVEWSRDDGARSDTEKYIDAKDREYDEEIARKETSNYLEENYDEKFTFRQFVYYANCVGVVYNIDSNAERDPITVTWYIDSSMSDNYDK